MKKRVPVSQIMTKNVVTLSVKDDLNTAEQFFKEHHIRHIPVTSGEEVLGMLSYTDLMRISFADAINENERTGNGQRCSKCHIKKYHPRSS